MELPKLRYIGFILLLISSTCSSPETINEEVKEIMFDEFRRNEFRDLLLVELRTEMYSSNIYDPEMYDAVQCIMIEMRNQFNIQVLKNGVVVIEGDTTNNISEAVSNYYLVNYEKNNVSNNFLFYSTISRRQVVENIQYAKQDAKNVENTQGVLQEVINFKWDQVQEWEQKKDIFNISNVTKIKEPHSQAVIILDYADTELGNAAMESILMALYYLRDKISKEYFKESYLKIYTRNKLMPNDLDQRKLNSFQILLPIRVLDVPYAVKEGVGIYKTPPPPLVYD